MVENELYVVGGSNTALRFGNIHKFDFSTRKWIYLNFENPKKFSLYLFFYREKKLMFFRKQKDILFKGRYGHGALIDNEEIYIYGGRDDDICDDILHLDLKAKTWNRKKVNRCEKFKNNQN